MVVERSLLAGLVAGVEAVALVLLWS